MKHVVSLLALAALVAGCTVGPDYQRPTASVPDNWVEADLPWQSAVPRDDEHRGAWWTLFNDPTLNALEQQALDGSFTLQAAVARVDLARAALDGSNAGHMPTVDLGERSTRVRTASNRPATGNGGVSSTLQNDHVLALGLSYELDLFGRVRRDIEAGNATVAQSLSDLENVRLVLTAEVASAYFSLRFLEAETRLLQETADLQQRSLDLISKRHAHGAVSGLDLAQQDLLVGNTRSQLQLSLRQQALQRHALATLLGTNANDIDVSAAYTPPALPDIPLTIPAELLQRRPDIAASERAVAAANAQIGVARSAWFPSLRISASDGLESRHWATLLDAPSNTWSLGLGLSQILFDGGRIRSRVAQAEANHQIATANYRQSVLRAFQDVEDALVSRRTLGNAASELRRSSHAADKVASITATRYELGAATALEHLVSQQNALNAQRQLLALESQQRTNVVALIRALGGRW